MGVLCGFDEKQVYVSGLWENQSQPPQRHPSSSLFVCDKICEETGLPSCSLQASGICRELSRGGGRFIRSGLACCILGTSFLSYASQI